MRLDFAKPIAIEQDVLYEGPHYTEGPVCDEEGNVYFTTLTGGVIYRLGVGGNTTVWAEGGWPNGQVRHGTEWLVCDSRHGRIVRYDHNGHLLGYPVEGYCAGVPVSVPNDMVVDETGGFYFTDSIRKTGRVFYVSATGEETCVAEGLDYPNGLVLTDGGSCLIVAESYANCLRRIRLTSAGIAGENTVLCTLPFHHSGDPVGNLPDGLALDGVGRIWVAHYGMGAIQVVSPTGELLRTLPTGIPLTSNLCFAGKNTIIVTGGFGEPGPGVVIRLTLMNENDE